MEESRGNFLAYFKEHGTDPIFVANKNKNKLFFHQFTCEEDYERRVYGIETVNDIFETKMIGHLSKSTNLALPSRILSLIYHLREGIEKGFNATVLKNYQQANEDYPQLYQIILKGISEKALENMKAHKMTFATDFYPENLGEIVATQIEEDRKDKSLKDTSEIKTKGFLKRITEAANRKKAAGINL